MLKTPGHLPLDQRCVCHSSCTFSLYPLVCEFVCEVRCDKCECMWHKCASSLAAEPALQGQHAADAHDVDLINL